MNKLLISIKIVGGLIALAGVVCLILAPIIGVNTFESLWAVEPFTYLGSALLVGGLAVSLSSYVGGEFRKRSIQGLNGNHQGNSWSETTLQYFQLFDHDLGRPLRRIAGKERELRAVMQAAPGEADAGVIDLLDEIERQTPNFRLMMSNIQVLIQLESPDHNEQLQPVEPTEVIRRIADLYTAVATEAGKEITWWSEPSPRICDIAQFATVLPRCPVRVGVPNGNRFHRNKNDPRREKLHRLYRKPFAELIYLETSLRRSRIYQTALRRHSRDGKSSAVVNDAKLHGDNFEWPKEVRQRCYC